MRKEAQTQFPPIKVLAEARMNGMAPEEGMVFVPAHWRRPRNWHKKQLEKFSDWLLADTERVVAEADE